MKNLEKPPGIVLAGPLVRNRNSEPGVEPNNSTSEL
jgi:hypothetical protein